MRSHEMKDDEILRQYLLGRLDEQQMEEIEQRLLLEDDLFELAEAVEGDLMAATARGELSWEERDRVRRRLAASPAGRARLAQARALVAVSREPASAKVLLFRYLANPAARAAMAASLLFMAGGLWVAKIVAPDPGRNANLIAEGLHPQEPERQPSTAPAPRPPAPPPEQIAEQPPAARPAPPSRPAVKPAPWVFQLALSTVRSAGSDVRPMMEIPSGTEQVEIQLPLLPGEPSASFAATLRNLDTGKELQRHEQITAKEMDGQRMIVLSVPAEILEPGTYEIEVRKTTTEGDELRGRPMFEVTSTNHPSRKSGDGNQ